MNKLKVMVILETMIIFVGLILLIINFTNLTGNIVQQKELYCDKYFYSQGICLLSPSIYDGVIQPNSLLLLNFDPLKNDIQNYISENNLNASVYVINLRSSSSFGINATQEFEPASLNKLPIAIIILKKVENGQLSLDTELTIQDYDRDSGSGNLYNSLVSQMSVKDLLYYMLADSDNTAFRVLEGQVTLEDLHDLSSYLDYYTKDINYNTLNNTYQITPKSVSNIFLSLYMSTDLKPEDSDLIMSDLGHETFDIHKYASIPENVTIVHKYGVYYSNNESYFHDCGIIYIDDKRIFYCVMTQGLSEEKGSLVIGTIVNKIYSFVTGSGITKSIQIN